MVSKIFAGWIHRGDSDISSGQRGMGRSRSGQPSERAGVAALTACRSAAPSSKLEPERPEREREKTEAEVVAQFEQWAKNPAVRDCLCQAWASPEERAQRLREIYGCAPPRTKSREEALADENAKKAQRVREIYGLPSEPEAEAALAGSESNPVKPSQTKIDPDQPKPCA